MQTTLKNKKMEQLIYKSIVENHGKLLAPDGTPLIRHFGLWNNQLIKFEGELPFELPAMLLEIGPTIWQPHKNNVREAISTFAWHTFVQ